MVLLVAHTTLLEISCRGLNVFTLLDRVIILVNCDAFLLMGTALNG